MLTQIAADYGGVSVSFPKNGSNSEVVKLSGARDCVKGAKQRIQEIVEDLESLVTIDCIIPQKFHRQVMGAKGSNVQEVTKQYNVTIKFPERPAPPSQDRDNQSPPVSHGSQSCGSEPMSICGLRCDGCTQAEPVEENGDDGEPLPQDIIVINGKKELAEEASAALKALVPITKEMEIPFEFHRYIIGQKGKCPPHISLVTMVTESAN